MKTKKTFPIIGIGASAGGLEPMKRFFAAMPADSGMAFIVVTHRAPFATSMLPEILGRITKMIVVEPGDKTTIKPNHVYISPPGHYLQIRNGALYFHHVVMEDGVSLPIDFFFRSLAESLKDKAICVILSGNGGDGTLGMTAIKGEGGMAMVQNPDTAQFASMPRQAVNTGLVDYALEPETMPEELTKYVATFRVTTPKEKPALQGDVLADILALVRRQAGSDFGQYKVNTLTRRIERRMNVHHISDVQQYVRYLRENEHEVNLLFKELLIGVTNFFRDGPAFELLEKEILPELLKDKAAGDSVRIWSAGCSTGEEAYSLAILLQEYMERTQKTLNVQIFASDIDTHAINHARAGVYADGIALDVAQERLHKYFTHDDGGFRVKKNIREMIIFAAQNLIHDPPFTKLDMISCRNLLIYLDGSLQKRIIPLFHYALRPGGVLFLGSSETVGSYTDLFTPVNTRWKIFKHEEVPLAWQRMPRWTNIPSAIPEHLPKEATVHMPNESILNITELAQKTLLAHHIPPSLIVNDKGDIFFIHGRTGQFLEPRSGQTQPQQNALDMAREGLQIPLAAVIRKAVTSDGEARQDGVRVRTNGHFAHVNLRAQKIRDPEALRGLIWISFEDRDHMIPNVESLDAPKIDGPEGELQFIKDNLHNTIEQLKVSNEDLKAANEELQSTNEELQSANEELETAKEEMQSLNEELHTVNAELESKVGELAHSNDDMKNLLNSTGIAMIFLDNQLDVRRFTSQARKIIHLIPGDVGRPISDIVSELEYKDLVRDATEVLQTLVFKEVEVRSRDWSWYLMRILPYRTTNNVIDGIAITFVDITRVKRTEILLAANIRAFQMMLLENAPMEKVLDELLLTIERQTNGSWCSISLLSEDGRHLVHGAAPSVPKSFDDALNGIPVAMDAPEPCAEAAALGRDILIPDLTAQAPQTPFIEVALRHNVKAAWSRPILSSDGELIGVFTAYYRDAHKPSEVEEELITQAMPLMATAISRLKFAK